MKNWLIAESDVLTHIAAGSMELASRIRPLATHIGPPGRSFRRTKSLTQVQQIHPAAVAETPLRVCEVMHCCLRVHMRPASAEHTLFQREGVFRQREFRRQTYRHGQ